LQGSGNPEKPDETKNSDHGKKLRGIVSEHNAKITWNHLLQQTSDWEGMLFGTLDWTFKSELSR